jgi:hypothetical protein
VINKDNAIVLVNSWGQANILYTSRKFFDKDAYATDVTVVGQSGLRNFLVGWTNLWYLAADSNTGTHPGLWRIAKSRIAGVNPTSTPYQGTRTDAWYPANQSSTTIPGRYSLMVNGTARCYDKLNSEHSFTNYTKELGRLSIGGINGWFNLSASPVAMKEMRVRNWNKDAAISISYGTIEQSSWIIDNITYTRRISVTINTAIDIEAYQVALDSTQWGSDFNIRIVGTGGASSLYPYIEYDTSCTPVVSSLRPSDKAVAFSHQPIEKNVWWVEKINKNNLAIYAPNSGKLGIVARPKLNTDVIKIYWIRARTYAALELIQMYESDINIMVEKKPTDWYLFDSSETSSSDKTYIVNCLNIALHTMVCGMYNKRTWVEFPDQTRYNAGFPGGYGRYIEYRK